MVDALGDRLNQQPQLAEAMAQLRDGFGSNCRGGMGGLAAGVARSVCHTIWLCCLSAQGEPLSARAAVRQLAQAGVAVSSGSACSSGSDQANPALLALGYNPRQARSGLRFSVGPWLQPKDFNALPALLESVLRQLPTVELP